MSTLFGASQLENFKASLDERSLASVSSAIQKITEVKKRGGKVMVVTGSGPNIHEGVTTLIAELIRVGIIDAVSTSSAVISHEMAGSLDRVFRVDAAAFHGDRQFHKPCASLIARGQGSGCANRQTAPGR